MILTPTVFVLGAGASRDFEFPIGAELLENVVKDLQSSGPKRDVVLAMGFSPKDLDAFSSALQYSADASIDAFLERRPEFMKIGKAGIAAELIYCEQTRRLFNFDKPHWMKYLFNRMQGTSFESFLENKVSFVTFNYDRCLEHFLCTALMNSWGKTEIQVGALLKKITIIHLHGQLGFLPWQSDTGETRPFAAEFTAEQARIAADGIKVVHEGIDDRREQFDAAKAAILAADRTYLLGIGTSNVNLERLGEKGFPADRVSATEVGLTQTEFEEVKARYHPRIDFRRHQNCYALISDYVKWD